MGMDREPMRKHLESIIEDLKSGAFAKRWGAERESGYESFRQTQKLAGGANPFSPIEERIRASIREAQARKGPEYALAAGLLRELPLESVRVVHVERPQPPGAVLRWLRHFATAIDQPAVVAIDVVD